MNRFDWQLWKRFWALAKPYWFSSEKWGARGILALLILLLLLGNGIGVALSFVNRDFMNALADKNIPKFYQSTVEAFGVIILAVPLNVFLPYIQEKLGIYWRRWLTNYLLNQYFNRHAFYEINLTGKIDNPDERISQDIHTFTQTSLSLFTTFISAILQLIAFLGILWSIYNWLVAVAIIYAAIGTVVTVAIGKKLIWLNFNQLRQEANFRYGLVHIRSHAEAIAFSGGEERESVEVKQRFNNAFLNFINLISWKRNLGFFTNSYNLISQFVPLLVLAPVYFAGKIKFGVLTQGADAFGTVLGAFSVIVNQFESLSAFAAVVNRLGTFSEAISTSTEEVIQPGVRAIDTVETVEDFRISLENVTLLTPDCQRTLVKNLSVAVQPGERLLITGESGTGKSSILRAIAGLWYSGTGRIVRPNLKEMLFLPQQPYMILGSLRSQLTYPNQSGEITDEQLYRVLEQVNLADLLDKVGGFDAHLDWAEVLSVGEQQRLAFARLLLTQPQVAILDEATSALDIKNEEYLYQQLQSTATTYISVGHRPSLLNYHQRVLKLTGDANWQLILATDYPIF